MNLSLWPNVYSQSKGPYLTAMAGGKYSGKTKLLSYLALRMRTYFSGGIFVLTNEATMQWYRSLFPCVELFDESKLIKLLQFQKRRTQTPILILFDDEHAVRSIKKTVWEQLFSQYQLRNVTLWLTVQRIMGMPPLLRDNLDVLMLQNVMAEKDALKRLWFGATPPKEWSFYKANPPFSFTTFNFHRKNISFVSELEPKTWQAHVADIVIVILQCLPKPLAGIVVAYLGQPFPAATLLQDYETEWHTYCQDSCKKKQKH